MRILCLFLTVILLGCSVDTSQNGASSKEGVEMMLNSELEKHLKNLSLEDFNFEFMTKEDSSFEFRWIQTQGRSIYRISIYMSEYNDYYSVDSIDAYINYLDVEEIVEPVFKEYNIPNNNGYTLKQKKSTVDIDEHGKIKELKVFNEKNCLVLIEKVKEYINNNLLDFFNIYGDIKSGYLEIEKQEVASLVRLIGQPLPFRLMVIKFLEDREDYKVYTESILNYYSSENKSSQVEAINAIKSKLELIVIDD